MGCHHLFCYSFQQNAIPRVGSLSVGSLGESSGTDQVGAPQAGGPQVTKPLPSLTPEGPVLQLL